MAAVSFDIGLRNLAVCKLDVDKETKKFSITYWKVLSAVPDDMNVNKTALEELCPLFSTLIETHLPEWTADANVAFIESQPMGRTRNLKTKVLSHILQVGLLRAKPDMRVQFIHPTLKLKNMTGPRDYRKNKAHAVAETQELIDSDKCQSENAPSLFVGKKRDDLADAFLQGYHATWCEPPAKRARQIKKKENGRSKRLREGSL
jgi:hypothetical protein